MTRTVERLQQATPTTGSWSSALSHNIINPLNTLTKLTKMIPDNPYTTPFLAASGIVGTLTLDHVNTFVAICVGVLTMVYLGIKIYKEFTKKL